MLSALFAILGASAASPTIEIAPGVLMPMVSLGHPDDGSQELDSAALWLKLAGAPVGIDTAADYHNQDQVGRAMRESGRPRGDVFVTTKIGCPRTGNSTAAIALAAVRQDLKDLQLPRADLVLLHFPCSDSKGTVAAYQGLQQALALNLTRAIGVSNFGKDDLDAVLAAGGSKPSVNQCAMSIGNHDDATIAYTKSLGITYESYSPLRHVDLGGATLGAIATAHAVAPAQVALKFITQQGIPLATSPGTNEQYSKEDLALSGFTLSDAEMAQLAALTSSRIK